MEKIIKLKPIIEDKSEYDQMEKKIIEWYKKELYIPIFKIINPKQKIFNALSKYLQQAIQSGKVYYAEGKFKGKFNSKISKELKEIGAKYDNFDKSYKIALDEIPFEIRSEISLSKAKMDENVLLVDKKLQEISSENITDRLFISKYFDKTLFKVEKEFQDNVKNITIVPQLNAEQRKQIADEWETNLKLYIKNFSDQHILDLRQTVKDNVLAGNRREKLIKTFMDSYNVTENKAKFWARQETNLMMAKYKETKYVAAGVEEYEWRCVHMPHQSSPNNVYKPGEVRYSHGILQGKIFSWKDPPVTTAPGQAQRRNNPGQDYNCRCFAIPIVRFKK